MATIKHVSICQCFRKHDIIFKVMPLWMGFYALFSAGEQEHPLSKPKMYREYPAEKKINAFTKGDGSAGEACHQSE